MGIAGMHKQIQSSITKRWLRGSLFITVLVLIIAEAIFMFYTYNSYYASTRQAIQSRISTIDGRLQTKSTVSETERALMVSLILEEFSEREKFELMLLNAQGDILSTSSGFIPQDVLSVADFEKAQRAKSGIGESIYTRSTGEKVMSITYLVPGLANEVAALRFVTSLAKIDNQIALTIFLSVIFAFVILLVSIVSGLYFIKSIVSPLHEVERTAAKISKGDFDVRLESKYNDEVGRLCKTINSMADELGKTDQLKNEFISSVSHELRTPLTSIKGWIETLARVDDPQNENYKRGMNIVRCETDRLYEMVEELLDFSRMQNDGMHLELQRLDLVAEVSDATIMVQQRGMREGVMLEYTEPEDIIIVNADSNRLKQVFVNILDNAFKYSSRGCKIAVEVYKQDQFAFVAISDQGPGIAYDEIEKVKTKFYKGKGAVRGSGIGLAVVAEILQAHGGDFSIESTQGEGTTISIQLPLA